MVSLFAQCCCAVANICVVYDVNLCVVCELRGGLAVGRSLGGHAPAARQLK